MLAVGIVSTYGVSLPSKKARLTLYILSAMEKKIEFITSKAQHGDGWGCFARSLNKRAIRNHSPCHRAARAGLRSKGTGGAHRGAPWCSFALVVVLT